MLTVKTYLEAQGRRFPEADAQGSISGAQYEAAGLPMAVACSCCQMTMVLTPDRPCDDNGHVYCASCAEAG